MPIVAVKSAQDQCKPSTLRRTPMGTTSSSTSHANCARMSMKIFKVKEHLNMTSDIGQLQHLRQRYGKSKIWKAFQSVLQGVILQRKSQ
jgi:hypothetical protein